MTVFEAMTQVLSMVPGADLSDFLFACNESVRSIHEAHGWSWLRKVGQIALAESVSDSTVTVENGSSSVIPAASVFSAALIGYKFRVSGESRWYTVVGFPDPGITLDAAYEGEDQVGAAYAVYQDEYALPSDFKAMDHRGLRNPQTDLPLIYLPELDFDVLCGRNPGTISTLFAYLGFTLRENSSTGLRQLQLSSAPSEAGALTLYYRRKMIAVTDPASNIDLPDGYVGMFSCDLARIYSHRSTASSPTAVGYYSAKYKADLQRAISVDNRIVDVPVRNRRTVWSR